MAGGILRCDRCYRAIQFPSRKKFSAAGLSCSRSCVHRLGPTPGWKATESPPINYRNPLIVGRRRTPYHEIRVG